MRPCFISGTAILRWCFCARREELPVGHLVLGLPLASRRSARRLLSILIGSFPRLKPGLLRDSLGLEQRCYMNIRGISVLLLLILFVAGCGSSSRVRYDSPEEALTKGKDLYERGRYDRAVEYFQGVFDFGRAHEWAADAQLYLARSYRDNSDYILAASEYSRFIEIYRTDPRVPDAEYERALTYYERSPIFQLDQTDTERAVDAFNLFANRYPTHPLRIEAEARVEELRAKLARKQYQTAQLYERHERYRAAAISYETVFDKYPDTDWADDALLGAVRTYIQFSDLSVLERQEERLQKAIDNYLRLLQIFPDSPLLKDAEALYEVAIERRQSLTSYQPENG